MKKNHYLLLVLAVVCCFSTRVLGQASAYTMTPSLVTYTDITGGTQLTNIEADGGISTVTLGFPFEFEGISYPSVRVTSDGYLSFNVTGATFSAGFNDLDGSNQRPLVAALWDDLDGRATNSEFRHEVVGTTPNREHVFQWNEWEWNWQASDEVISFQIRLHETTHLIDFVYRQDANTPNSPGASIGLAGAVNLNFLSLQGTTTAPATSNTIEATFLTARPATGQQYRFTPPTCPAPSNLAQTGSSASTISLSWTSGGASDWNVEYGTAGFVPGTGTHLTASTTASLTITGLTASACFDVYVRDTCAPGDESIWVGPVQMCTAFSAPLLENFDSNPSTTLFAPTSTSGAFDNGWSWNSNSAFGIFGWLGRNNRTSSSPGGPWFDHTTGTTIYLYCENSSGGVGDSAHLYSPFIDISTVTNPTVRMWYHKWSTSATGVPDIVLYADTGNGFDVLMDDTTMIDGTHTGDANADPWDELLVQLPPTTATTVQFRITQIKEFCCSDAAIDDFEVFDLLDDDMKMVDLIAPVDGGCEGGGRDVIVEVQNNGAMQQTSFDVAYQIDGGTPVVETANITIAPFDRATYTFTTKATFTAGTAEILAWTALTGDGFLGNDTLEDTVEVIISPIITDPIYCYGFENGDQGWSIGGTNASWEIGAPTGSFISSAANGNNAAVTSLTGRPNVNENSYFQTPCFDFSEYENDPTIEFSHIYDVQGFGEQGFLEVSTDGGVSWDVVGRQGDGTNWYDNPANVWGSNSGSSGVWRKARILVEDVAGEAQVNFRFRMQTDGFVSTFDDGMGIDDFTIVTPPNDLFPDMVSTCNDPNFTLDAGTFYNDTNATYLWSTGDTTAEIGVTTAGIYTVTITDNKIGLSFSESVEVVALPPPTVAFATLVDTIDGNGLPAVIDLSPQLPANYTYEWSDGTTFPFFVANPANLNPNLNVITVTVTDTLGCSSVGTHQIFVSYFVGIEGLAGSKLSYYPNPVSDQLTVRMEGPQALGQVNITIMDYQGKQVYKTNVNDNTGSLQRTIDVSELPSGMYIMQFANASGVVTEKLVIE